MVFDFDQIEPTINAEYLRRLFSDEEMYRHYCPEFQIGDIHSPFRTDNSPSFGFYQSKSDDDRILWKDAQTGETGNVFTFIRRILPFTGPAMALYERIYNDLKGNTKPEALIIKQRTARKPITTKRKVSILDVVQTAEGDIPRAFMPFWENMGITRNILDAYHTGFAVEVWLTKIIDGQEKRFRWGTSTNDNPIFYYHFPHSGHFKIYRPYEKVRLRKWISNTTNDTDVQGYYQCDIKNRKPKLLVLTKSMKDVMFLRSLGVDAMALHGERHNVNPEFIAHLKRHCGFIISLYDNDIPGIRGGIYLRDNFDIPMYFIPTCYGVKDCTDLYRADYQRCFLLADILNEVLKHGHPNRYTGIGAAA